MSALNWTCAVGQVRSRPTNHRSNDDQESAKPRSRKGRTVAALGLIGTHLAVVGTKIMEISGLRGKLNGSRYVRASSDGVQS